MLGFFGGINPPASVRLVIKVEKYINGPMLESQNFNALVENRSSLLRTFHYIFHSFIM
jgi:hypothetical protein